MFKIVRKSDATIRKIAENKMAINLITKDITPNVSLAVTEATNYFEREIAEYNRIYYVTEGVLTLKFDNNKNDLEVGDSCFISKGTTYEMSGTFKAVIVNQPAFGS